jgi:uncharacterized protein YcbK (DUF882 family)
MTQINRRALVLGGAGLVATAAVGACTHKAPPVLLAGALARPTAAPAPAAVLAAPALRTAPAVDARRLYLHNLHTGDTVRAVYWENGAYVQGALAEARHALRDWRNGDQHAMDPGLFDIFHRLSTRLEINRPFQIISGYRSPATNAALRARSSGVASRSLHMDGQAADIRVEGVDLRRLRAAALDLGRGGVGFYPVSNFVHVDTGRVRQWAGA